MTMEPALEARLRQSRLRWWLRQMVGSGVWGWGVAAGLVVLQLLAARLNLLAAHSPWLPLGAGLVVFGLHLAWSGRSAPSLQRLAQQADREFDLHEQLSTAREYQPHHQGLVAEVWRLQRSQAATLVDRLVPSRLVPLTWPPLARWAALCSLLGLGLYFWPGLAPRAQTVQNPSAGAANPELVTQLEALEQVVRSDAERRNDPVLQATVQSLRQLRQDVAQNRLTPEQLNQQVELVNQRVAQNYGLAATPPPSTQPDSLDTPPTSTASQGGEAPSRTVPPAQEETASTPAAAPSPAQAAQKIEETVNRLQQQSAGSSKPSTPPGQTPPPQKAQSSCGNNCQEEQPTDQYSAGAKQEAERRAMEAARRPPGGDPGGYGNEAGQGSPSQTAAANKPLPPRQATTTVKVSTRPSNTGSRIKIAAPPSPTPSTRLSATVGQVSFSQQTEEPMPVQPVIPRNRAVVARYFAPAEENP